MKRTSIFKFLALPMLVSLPIFAQAYTVIINGTSFETSRPPTVDVDYLSTGVRVTIAGVDITAASGSSSSTSSSSSSSSSSSDGECTSTWGCGDSDSSSSDDNTSDDSTTTTTTTTTTTDDVNQYSQGECTNTDRVACHNYDWGPAGLGSFWTTSHTIPGGKVFAVPFTVRTSGTGPFGTISTSRKSGEDTNGYGIRMWFSKTPGGKIISASAGGACGRKSSATGGMRWAQAAERWGYCNLPSTEKTTYYFNVALCNSTDSDVECLNSDAEFNPKSYSILFSARNY